MSGFLCMDLKNIMDIQHRFTEMLSSNMVRRKFIAFPSEGSTFRQMLQKRLRRTHLWKKFLGTLGEFKARQYLKKSGIRIITTNFRTKKNEVDIIALDGTILLGIEVKTRINPLVAPEDVPDERKILKVAAGIKQYCRSKFYFPERLRIDIVGVEIKFIYGIPRFQIIWLQGNLQHLSNV